MDVISKGFDEDVNDVINSLNNIAQKALEYKSRLILCDERELEYRLTTIDTFQIASYASKYSKYLVKIAIVFNGKFYDDIKFYQTVTNNRGLQVQVLNNVQDAEKWLKLSL